MFPIPTFPLLSILSFSSSFVQNVNALFSLCLIDASNVPAEYPISNPSVPDVPVVDEII